MGWERKRGLLTELNSFLRNKNQKNTFMVNTLKEYKDLDIKYIITLDADTELTLNAGIELIEAMAHPLNKPKIVDGKVQEGHAIMQPRVGISLEKVVQSVFSEIYAGSGGVDSYTNAISDTYQDNFGEGIYTGKGIYDVEVFYNIMKDKIPENTILSHDLLEGSLLRCGLVSDVMLLDGYPRSYIAFLTRLHRWIRGDYQTYFWLTKNKDKVNKLSKFKIIDNIRRSLIEISVMLCLFTLIFSNIFLNAKVGFLWIITLLSVVISSIIEGVNYIIFRKENIKRQRKFTDAIDELTANFYRAIISIMTIPSSAYLSVDAALRTIYRVKVSKKNLLEWTTSEDVESSDNNNLKYVLKKMLPNLIIGAIILFLGLYTNGAILKIFIYILAVMFFAAPFVMQNISKEKVKEDKFKKLNE